MKDQIIMIGLIFFILGCKSIHKNSVSDVLQLRPAVKGLANYLQKNPDANVNLQGSIGLDKTSMEAGVNWGSNAGGGMTMEDLAIGRAEAVKNLLVNDYGIDESRVSTGRGTLKEGTDNKKVDAKIE